MPWRGHLWYSARAWGRDALWLCAGVLLTVLPATLRNRVASGQWVPVTTNFGINLYLGNHAGADGLIGDDPARRTEFRSGGSQSHTVRLANIGAMDSD